MSTQNPMPTDVSPDPSCRENGDVGLERTPSTMPSRDGRVATVEIDDCRLVVGYNWAVYAHIDSHGSVSVFRGWKNFSSDTRGAIAALEAAAARTLSGAPAIDLPDSENGEFDLSYTDKIIHIRTKNSEAPTLLPTDALVFEVDHDAEP